MFYVETNGALDIPLLCLLTLSLSPYFDFSSSSVSKFPLSLPFHQKPYQQYKPLSSLQTIPFILHKFMKMVSEQKERLHGLRIRKKNKESDQTSSNWFVAL